MNRLDRDQRSSLATEVLVTAEVLEIRCQWLADGPGIPSDARKLLVAKVDELEKFRVQVRTWLEIWRLQ